MTVAHCAKIDPRVAVQGHEEISMRTIPAMIMVAAILLGTSGHARADVVGPPPDECPMGSQPGQSHSGPYCGPDLCQTDHEANRCSATESCQAMPLCVENRDYGGRYDPRDDAARPQLSDVKG